ncbi:MAG: ABC transporter permease [Planctomycetota bacterium]|jgi:ABC-2 type transport system permease protein
MNARFIILKDLVILTRDRRALAILLAMPLVFIGVLGFSTGKLLGWQNENNVIRIALVDRAEDELVGQILASLREREVVELTSITGIEAAYALVDDGDCQAAIVVECGFRERVDALTMTDVLNPSAGRLSEGLWGLDIHVYSRPTQAVAAGIVRQLVFGACMRVLLPYVARGDPLAKAYLQVHTADSETRQDSPGPARGTPPGGQTNMGNMAYQIIVPAYTVLFAFFLINLMARSFLIERAQGTLRRLRAAPIGTGQLLIGKTMPFFIVSVIQGLLLFAFGRLLFGMSWGQVPWMLLPVIFCTSVAARCPSIGLCQFAGDYAGRSERLLHASRVVA